MVVSGSSSHGDEDDVGLRRGQREEEEEANESAPLEGHAETSAIQPLHRNGIQASALALGMHQQHLLHA